MRKLTGKSQKSRLVSCYEGIPHSQLHPLALLLLALTLRGRLMKLEKANVLPLALNDDLQIRRPSYFNQNGK